MDNPCSRYSSYIRDLTSSYTDKSNDSAMVSASVLMFALTVLFFNLNIFSGVSDVSAIVDPKVRLFLTSALSLFLPVMSYLFSEAKNAGGYTTTSPTPTHVMADLSLRAGLILAWMLLVELLRKKVDVIHVHSYSGIIQRAARVIWLGNLVFFNIRAVGPKAVFSVLWILCATKLLQRIAFTEVGKRSYAHGKNSRLISSYMAQILGHNHDKHLEHGGGGGLSAAHDLEQAVQQEGGDEQLLKRCMYIVMGEEELVEEPTADGYKLKTMTTASSEEGSSIVTVGKVWEFVEKDELFVTSSDKLKQQLKRICFSFALFKLLRRRIEHPQGMTDREARSCRDLLLKGLYNSNNGGGSTAVFQVINDEVTFLSEYYHSVVPVVLASPFFFFVNYFLLHIVVIMLCLMTIVICGQGDVSSAIYSMGRDSYYIKSGVANVVACLVSRASLSTAAFFSVVDLSITVLLFLIFFYEEIWEFLVFLLSGWFIVSLLCNHIAKPHSRSSRRTAFRCAVHTIMWLRSKMSHTTLSLKQFSVLNLRWPLEYLPLLAIPYAVVETKLVPKTLKQSILEYLVEHDRGTAGYTPLTSGKSALQRNSNLYNHLSWACKMDSVAEVILTWHIATGILEAKCAPQSGKDGAALSRVAIRLSKYCAYLVAFHPELLPDDNQEKTELVLEDMYKELKSMLGCRAYYLSSQRARIDKILLESTRETTTGLEATTTGGQTSAGVVQSDDRNKVVVNGAKLCRSLMAEASNDPQAVWKVLADMWTELIIYVAPSSDDDRLKGHEDVLAQGGEFITLIWALTTHIGMSRPPPSKETTGDHTEEALEE